MKLWIVALGLLVSCASVQAKTAGWEPSAGHTQVPIWPGVAPDLKPVPGPETVRVNTKILVGGLPR